MKRIKIKYKTKRRIAIISALAAVGIFIITPIGQSTALTAIDGFNNLTHGRYGSNIEKRVDSFKRNIDERIMDQFEKAGGTIEILDTYEVNNKKDNPTVKVGKVRGTYNSTNNKIRYAQSANSETVYHEFGHYIDKELGERFTGKRFSESDAFLAVTKEEIEPFNKNVFFFNEIDYSLKYYEKTHKASEYFAEAFAYYMMFPNTLKHAAPATYEYMDMLYTTITK